MLRDNNSTFVTKALREAIMKRSRLNIFFIKKKKLAKTGSIIRCKGITVATLLKKAKKNYFTNLNIKEITDTKTFWKTIKSSFNETSSSSSKITLSEKGFVLSGNKKLYNKMNNYFINITKTLNLKPYKCSNTMNIIETISKFDNT